MDVDAIVVTVISSEEPIIDEIKTYGYTKGIGLSDEIKSLRNMSEYNCL